MKQQEVFKKIGGIIKELNEQYNYLREAEDNMNDLELELFVANTHFLTDHVEILRKLNAYNHKELPAIKEEIQPLKKEKKAEESYFEPFVQQVKPPADQSPVQALPKEELITKDEAAHEEPVMNHSDFPEVVIQPDQKMNDTPVPEINLSEQNDGEIFSYIRQPEEPIRHELVLDEAHEEDDTAHAEQGTNVHSQLTVEPKIEKPQIQPVNQDSINIPNAAQPFQNRKADDEVMTINQMISSQMTGKTSETPALQPVTDLKSAITLNDKLLFVKDLFNGYSLAYSEAIEILNRFDTFDEANKFLANNYAIKHHWETKQAASEKFYALLRRRFAS